MKTQVRLFLEACELVINADKALAYGLVVFIILSSLLPILAINSSAEIINSLIQNDAERAFKYIVLWGFFIFIYDMLSPVITFLQSCLGDKAVFKINSSIMKKADSFLGLENFENSSFYNDLQVIQANAYNRPINMVVTLAGLFKDFCLLAYCLSFIFFHLSFLSIVILIGTVIQAKIISKIQVDMWSESFGRSLRSRFMHYISGLSINSSLAKETRIFPISSLMFKRYTGIFEEMYAVMLKLRLRLILWPILPSIILIIVNSFALKHVIEKVIDHNLEAGIIAIIIQCLMQLHSSVLSIGEQAGWLSGHLLFFEKYFSLLAKKENKFFTGGSYKITEPFILKSIKVENLCFSYQGNRVALENINFEIKKNEKLAIVGVNGSGKTTLIKLLCGFYQPTSGQILINNIPVENYDLKQLRSHISAVFQDFGAYAMSVEENIIMGQESDSQKLAMSIAQNNADFIYALPGKLQHMLGKQFDGTDLSIGQWQKIAILRAMYKQAELFILDEPTASLDPINEHEVFESFSRICAKKMTIFVTHRLTSIGLANKILLLDKGRQMGYGSHLDLLNSNAIYKKMFNLQAKRLSKLKPSRN